VLVFVVAAVGVYFAALQEDSDTVAKVATLPTDAPIEVVPPVVAVEQAPSRPVSEPASKVAPVALTPPPQVAKVSVEKEREVVAPVASVSPPPPARPPRELSVTQLKERTISLARTGEIPDALASLRTLQSKLSGEDDPINQEAKASIAQAYARLAERSVLDGNYSAAIALLSRADEMNPNLPIYTSRRQEIERIARFSESLEHGSNLSADALREELGRIRETEGPQYYAVRSRLASVMAQRVQERQGRADADTKALIALAQQLFEGIPEIDRLGTVDQSVASD
jgi:hypothetical protein